MNSKSARNLALVSCVFYALACTELRALEKNELSFATLSPIHTEVRPLEQYNTFDVLISQQLWFPILYLNELGQVSSVFADRWHSDNQGKTWTIEFKQNLKWSDGTPLTIDELYRSIRLSMLDSATSPLKKQISDIRLSLPNKVVIYLHQANPDLLTLLTRPYFLVTDPKKPGRVSLGDKSLRFSGPYKISNINEHEAVIVKNPFFGASDTHPKMPTKVSVVGNLDAAEVQSRLTLGQSNFARLYDDSLNESQLEQLRNKGFRVLQETSRNFLSCFMIGPRLKQDFSSNIQQFLFRILNSSALETLDFGMPAFGLTPPFILGALNKDEWTNQVSNLPKKASFKRPIRLFVMKAFSDSSVVNRAIEALRSNSVPFEVVVYDPKFQDSNEFKERSESKYDLIYLNYDIDYVDPALLWDEVLTYEKKTPKPIVQAELEKARSELNLDKRSALYKALEYKNFRDPFIIPMRFIGTKIIYGSNFKSPNIRNDDVSIQFYKFELKTH